MSGRLFILGCMLVSTMVIPMARAADPQRYKVEFASAGGSDIDSTLKATSDLQQLRSSSPVSPFGLIARARGDVDRLKTVVESYGYYESHIDIKINGILLSDPGLGDALNALQKGDDAQVAISFTLGPLYHLRHIDIDGEVPGSVDARTTLGLSTGQTAIAADVLAGGSRLLTAIQEDGYAFAKIDPPVAYQAADAPVLDVKFHVVSGMQANIGEIRIEGLQRVHEALLRKRLMLHTGDRFRPSAIEKARRDLLALNVFSQVSVQVGSQADSTGGAPEGVPDGVPDGVPITFKIRERLRHAVAVNAAYSSDLGGSGGITWTDRNVFGNAEQLTVAANVINLGGSDTTGVGYDASVKYVIPEFLHRDQSLQVTVSAVKQSLQAYDQTGHTSSVIVVRKISSLWTVSAGLAATDERITQETLAGGVATNNYTLIALPLNVAYDSTNLRSPLEDPRHGYRVSVGLAPTLALGRPNSTFIISTIKAAAFFDLETLLGTTPGRTVLATRALAGFAEGASEFSLPPDQRFYGGGSSTVRGYGYQQVGPEFPKDNLPIGGTAITSAGVELRQRFGTNFGAAFFVDAGQVSTSLKIIPDELSVGVGAGMRYYTPIGPIRFDVAVPTKRRPNDGPVQVYIGLGQAF